jgi:putative ABC transport system substrate-binding protein
MLFALCFPAQAQHQAKTPLIGYLGGGTGGPASLRGEAFRQGLRDLGYSEEKNISFAYQLAAGKLGRLPELAAELVRLKVDVIVAVGDGPIAAARQATSTIPIVMALSNDPVGLGHVASLAKPGGNVTGLSSISADLAGKRVELLKEIVPKASRLAVLRDPRNPGTTPHLREIEVAAKAFGLRTRSFDLRSADEIEPTFRAVAKDRADVLIIVSGAFVSMHRKQMLNSVVKLRMPTMCPDEEWVLDGGLMTYAASILAQHGRVAVYVDKILKGTKPADLPVEQPIKFEFVINLKAAKQIGLTIPPNVLARADRVIR